jgi:type VI secretion system protein ImpA
MALREDLLTPIPGLNPSGEDLRYNSQDPIHDKIKEARREDEDLPAGVWARERKIADYPLAARLATEAITKKSKDLQLAAWLAEAWLKTQGFPGLVDGLDLCHGLVNNFWDTVYPMAEDGDLELRAAPLEWLGSALDVPVRSVPLVQEGYGWIKYSESRRVGYEDQAKTDIERKARQQRIDEGKLPPEEFDKAIAATPKSFYKQAQTDLDASIAALQRLDQLCRERFREAYPSFTKLRKALEEVRHDVHLLLEKKLETDPDPVEEPNAEFAAGMAGGAAIDEAPAGVNTRPAGTILLSVHNSSEPPDRRQAIANIAAAAELLRQREPYSPAPYLLLRALRWGELRAGAALSDPTLLEAPPTELRQHIKRLALNREWKKVLEAAENAMALPCSRAWLDLQRFAVAACQALGPEYEPIATAIRSELKALLSDLPQLLDANLLDDTPAANAETRAWLRQCIEDSQPAAPRTESAGLISHSGSSSSPAVGWPGKAADSYSLAQEALKAGQPEKALEMMRREIGQSRSGRSRFLRTLQLAELCIAAGKLPIAQPLLDDLWTAIETHKMEAWEDPEWMAAVLSTLMASSQKIQGDAKLKQQVFERICRLDPVRALASSG